MDEPSVEIVEDVIQLCETIIRLVMLVKYQFRTPSVGERDIVKAGEAPGLDQIADLRTA